MAKYFSLSIKKKILAIRIKLAKIIGVFEVHFFSKVDSNRFFTTSKYAQIYNICQKSTLEKKFN